jgi:hypothetical protein
MQSHKATKHEGTLYECDHCDYKGKWRQTLSEHRRIIHVIFRYSMSKNKEAMEFKESICDLCGFAAMSTRNMEIHKMTTCNSASIDNLQDGSPCHMCDVVSPSAKHLYIHIIRKHKDY